MMQLYVAPDQVPADIGPRASVFLAGSIEQGVAEQWQLKAVDVLAAHPFAPQIVAFNPRRDQWDASWVQSIDNPVFAEQVNWELDQLFKSNVRFFYFQPGTMSPITLLEFGLVMGEGTADIFPVVVVCPEGFWRRGNIQIVCQRAGIPCFDTLEEGFADLHDSLTQYIKHAGYSS